MLPYSSKVEYVRSTGTQWFDTGCAPSAPRIEIDMAVEEWPVGTGDNESGTRPHMAMCGVNRFSFGDDGDHGSLKFLSGSSGTISHFNYGRSLESLVGERHTYIFDLINRKAGVDTASYSGSKGTLHDGQTVFLLASNMPRARRGNVRDGNRIYLNQWMWGAAAMMKARLYGAKLWDGMALLRDFIPVRIGKGVSSEGVLYDLVSGTVFRSAGDPLGTGCIGPDVKNDIRSAMETPYVKTGEMPVRLVGGFGDWMPDALTMDEVRDNGLPEAPLYTYLDYEGLNYSDEEVLDTFGSVPQVDVGPVYSPERGVVVLEIEAVSHLSDMPEIKLKISHTAGKTVTVDWDDVYYIGDDSGTDGTLEFFHRYYAPGTGKGTYLVKIRFEDGDSLSFENGFLSVPSADVTNGRRFSANLLMAVFGKGARADVSGITSLKTVFLSDKLDVVSGAFSGCASLESVCLPPDLTSVPSGLFQGIPLKSVVIPKATTSIGANAFKGVTTLKRVSLPYGLTSIGASAFDGCTSLNRLPVPKTLTSVGEASFRGCTSLEHMEFPDGVVSIPASCFEGCSVLSLVELCGSVSSLGARSFADCPKLGGVTANSWNINAIPQECFDGCASMSGEFLPLRDIISVGENAFRGCVALEFYKLGDLERVVDIEGGTSVSESPYVMWYAHTVRIHVHSSDPDSFRGVDLGPDFKGETEIVLDGSVVDSLKIPLGVTPVANGYFNCTGLKTLTVYQPLYGSIDTVFTGRRSFETVNVIMRDQSEKDAWAMAFRPDSHDWNIGLLDYPNSVITTIELSSSVTSVADSAFRNCTGLRSVSLPSSVASIGANAFGGCSGLNILGLSSSTTSVADSAFHGCNITTANVEIIDIRDWCASGVNQLLTGDRHLYDSAGNEITSVVVPSDAIIGGMAFARCVGLVSASVEHEIGVNETDIFKECTSLEHVSFSGACVNIPDSTCMSCSSLLSVSIGDGVSSIGECAFMGCSLLESVHIPASVTAIGWNAFSGCSSLASVSTPSLEAWLALAFGSEEANPCSFSRKLVIGGSEAISIDIPSSTERINNYAFSGLSSLVSVRFHGAVEHVGHNAFHECTGLERVVASSLDSWLRMGFENEYSNPCAYSRHLYFGTGEVTSVSTDESIDAYAFYNCSSITSVSCSSPVIGMCAFYGCTGIQTISIPTVGRLTSKAFGLVKGADATIGAGIAWSLKDAFYNGDLRTLTVQGGEGSVAEPQLPTVSGSMSVVDAKLSLSVGHGVNMYTQFGWRGSPDAIQFVNSDIEFDVLLLYGSRINSLSFNSCSIKFTRSSDDYNPFSHHAYDNYSDVRSLSVYMSGECALDVANGAFHNFDGDLSFTGMNSVKTAKIGESAFSGCTAFTSLTFEKAGGAVSIGASAFAECSALRSLSLGDQLSSATIGERAFYHSGLSQVYIGAPAIVGKEAFLRTSASKFVLGKKVVSCDSQSISAMALTYEATRPAMVEDAVKQTNSVSFGAQVLSVGGMSKLSGFSSFDLPSTMIEVQEGAFRYCANVERFSFPPSLSTIGVNAFRHADIAKVFDFSRHSSVPTLRDYRAFGPHGPDGYYMAPQIVVPSSLLSKWKKASQWKEASDRGYIRIVSSESSATTVLDLSGNWANTKVNSGVIGDPLVDPNTGYTYSRIDVTRKVYYRNWTAPASMMPITFSKGFPCTDARLKKYARWKGGTLSFSFGQEDLSFRAATDYLGRRILLMYAGGWYIRAFGGDFTSTNSFARYGHLVGDSIGFEPPEIGITGRGVVSVVMVPEAGAHVKVNLSESELWGAIAGAKLGSLNHKVGDACFFNGKLSGYGSNADFVNLVDGNTIYTGKNPFVE